MTPAIPPRQVLGPVCWGCDPSRIAGLVRRLLRLQPAQHRCQGMIRYATTVSRCRCTCRPARAGSVTVTVDVDVDELRERLERARRAADEYQPGRFDR